MKTKKKKRFTGFLSAKICVNLCFIRDLKLRVLSVLCGEFTSLFILYTVRASPAETSPYRKHEAQ